MDYIFNNDRAIYIQLVEKIKIEIISEKLKAGERLPSVRDLALTAKVNPNTMQKALIELEDIGLVYTERTTGKYVTKDKQIIKEIKKELANEKTNNYLNDMGNIGMTYEEVIRYLQELGGDK